MHDRPLDPRRRRPLRIAAACAALLVSSACGARWDAEQRAAVVERGRAAGLAAGPAGSTGADATTGGGDAGTTGTGDVTATGGPGTATAGTSTGTGGGTGRGATGGTGGARTAAGSAPCRAPSNEVGVTKDAITLGTISSVTGPVPGLGASATGAVRAYVAYRNATGGVCGRRLALKTADDGADNGRHRALVNEFAGSVLALAGGVGGGDAGSGDVVVQRKLPVVATPISDQFQNAATVFDINPPYANPNAPIAKYRFLHSQGVRTASIVYPATDQTRSEAVKHKGQMEGAGIRVVQQQEVPLSTLSWDSTARQVANSKADYMLFISDATMSASLARSMRDTGYKLKFEEYLTAYGSNFIELAGEAANGTSSWTRTLPNEDPPGNAEQAAFEEWMARVSGDVPPDTFAADSWSGAKAIADSLTALPGPITRDALLAKLRATNPYDAGGLLGPIQLGRKLNNGCFVGMIVEGNKWRRITPATGFLC